MHRYYKRRIKFIIRLYGYLDRRSEKILRQYFEKGKVDRIINGSKLQYDQAIRKLPSIGGCKNSYTPIMIINGWFISIFKAMKREGLKDDSAMYVIYRTMEGLLDKLPRFTDKLINKVFFTKVGVGILKRKAKKSRKKKYEGDFVFSVETPVWGKERAIDIKFDECGVHKYYERTDCPELKKYCNFFDPMYAKRFKMGLDANHTFAQGCDQCVLSTNNKRRTINPENIEEMIKTARSELNVKTDD